MILTYKQLLVSLFFFLSISNCEAQQITVSIPNLSGNIKSVAEINIAKLLTACNQAQAEKKDLSLSGISISDEAKNSLMTLWETCPFRCSHTTISKRYIENGKYMQIRNIPIQMIPLEGETFGDDDYQETVINIDQSGKITEINLSLPSHLYSKTLEKSKSVTDLRHRQIILDFIENFRTAYNRKDLNLLKKVFSEDALIITGNVIKTKTSDGNYNIQKIVRKKQSKLDYINGLQRVFTSNNRINVKFSNLNVIQHPTSTNYYGVTLTQGWYADRYNDEGYLFLLIDFTDEQNPQIHVRAWDDMNMPENERVYLSDFDV